MLYFDDRNYFISEHVYVFSEHVGGTFYRNFTIDRENLILAVVLLVAFSVLFRNIRKAFLTSEIALLLFMNFNTILGAIKKIIPGMRKAYFFL